MAKLLYITAHPLDELVSNSMATGKAFIDAYQDNHSGDEVKHIDLFTEDIPHIDKDVLIGWGKAAKGEELTSEESKKVTRLGAILDEFLEADKYVFVSPMWNLSFPPVLKAYIDAITVAGKTFKYTSEGLKVYSLIKRYFTFDLEADTIAKTPTAEIESGDRYLRNIMTFLGVPSYETVIIEGHNAEPEKAEEIKLAGVEEAKELAKTF